MKREDLDTIVRKVEELRALMVFAQRTMPFLDDVFTFVREIVPLLDVLRASVESTSDKLPKASKQLDKVTTATELASTEILNIVEGMFAKLNGLREDLGQRQRAAVGAERQFAALAADLEALVAAAGGTQEARRVAVAARDVPAILHAIAPDQRFEEVLEGLQSDCTNIMIALQVQDITAQQIAAVNTLMESVDQGLSRLLKHFDKTSVESDATRFRHRSLDIVFDVSAEYGKSEDRQRMADALVEESRTRSQARKNGRRPARRKKRE
jgi:chemotaxis regulatin CheY-phosphate phosphatase CheZ